MSGTRRNSTPLRAQLVHGFEDVTGDHGNVLGAGSEVVIDILLDLALAQSLGRFIDRELDPSVAILHYLGHQGGIFGGDILVIEGHQLTKAHHLVVEVDPVIHLAELHVADDMVDRGQPG